MNLIQIEEQLKSLPDEALAKEVKSPSGLMPPYMVLGEMTRRQKTRESFGSAQLQPKQTVADEMVSKFKPGGQKAPAQQIGLPQLPSMDAGPPMPKFAKGGLVDMLSRFSAGRDAAESGGDYNARNKAGSGAFGRYQFMPSTWNRIVDNHPELGLDHVTKGGKIPSKEQQDLAYNEVFLPESIRVLKAQGVPVNDQTLYLAHKYGPGSVKDMLNADGNMPMSALLRQLYGNRTGALATEQNRLAGKTVADEIGAINKRFGNPELVAALGPSAGTVGKERELPPSRTVPSGQDQSAPAPTPNAPPGDTGQMMNLMRLLMAQQQAPQPRMQAGSPRLIQGNQAPVAMAEGGPVQVFGGKQYRFDKEQGRFVEVGGEDAPITRDTMPSESSFGPNDYMPKMSDVGAPPSFLERAVQRLSRPAEENAPETFKTLFQPSAPPPATVTAGTPSQPGPAPTGSIFERLGKAAMSNPVTAPLGAAASGISGLVRLLKDQSGNVDPTAPTGPGGQATVPSLASQYEEVSALQPDRMVAIEQERKSLLEDLRNQRKMAANLALAQAGFAIASGTSPFFAENLGKGALAGLGSYQASLDNEMKNKQMLLNQGVDLTQAQLAGDRSTLSAASQIYVAKVNAASDQIKAQIAAAAKGGGVEGDLVKQMYSTIDGMMSDFMKSDQFRFLIQNPATTQEEVDAAIAKFRISAMKQVSAIYKSALGGQ